MTNMPGDVVGEILQDEKFTIVDVSVDPETDETSFTVVHDVHPDDEVQIKLVSNEEDGKEAMTLEFNGPDIYSDEEAKEVLNEVMEVIVKIVEQAIKETEEGSTSGSGSGSASASASGEG